MPEAQFPEHIINKVAVAIALNGFGRPFDDFFELSAEETDQSDLREYARAAVKWLFAEGLLTMPAAELLAVRNAGYVVVPREPTGEMKAVVRNLGGKQALAYALAAWPDMLAAAPKFL